MSALNLEVYRRRTLQATIECTYALLALQFLAQTSECRENPLSSTPETVACGARAPELGYGQDMIVTWKHHENNP